MSLASGEEDTDPIEVYKVVSSLQSSSKAFACHLESVVCYFVTMPPPKDKQNPLAAPGELCPGYLMLHNLIFDPGDDFTETLHSEPYPAIDSSKADFTGKHVFICGASKGIGRAIAVSFARAGASHIAIGARSDLTATEKALQEAAVAIGKSSPKVLQVKVDITSQESVDSSAKEVEKMLGQLDVLVHNAGIFGANAPITDSKPDIWWKTWELNVRGPYLVTRAFLPLLLKEGDKQIVYVTSVGAWLTNPGLSAYQPSKLALSRFTEFVNQEYGGQGLVAFSIHPGNVPGTDILGPGGVPDALKHGMFPVN